jgi:hypothetical protein
MFFAFRQSYRLKQRDESVLVLCVEAWVIKGTRLLFSVLTMLKIKLNMS